MKGFEDLGAEPTASEKTADFFKEVAPSLVTATAKAIEGKPASPPLPPAPSQQGGMPSWAWPAVGVGAAGLVGFFLFKAVRK